MPTARTAIGITTPAMEEGAIKSDATPHAIPLERPKSGNACTVGILEDKLYAQKMNETIDIGVFHKLSQVIVHTHQPD
ncbi:hypothetical protein SARC_07846 [Sphaeroforma arctica JP610]|uniref:Uncharacterized protein n=1 Tax=Sphaeroforma arctica JP610 TaxID=667725 RepID=A0A0L0FV07_9EUKA|nr:hypothetical protein SARC_07846 [Sphaeroforma arctica JP610]KNC79773.1 hypothetical protein SARC_07846 [Sphaeroforma arctica JP610]|eukprot:XP_014153675.1 hypothetical protein SARC_07846 [Sphaeroforma arctica JP610]